MPAFAFLLVVAAAVAHAIWNLLAKRSAQSRHLIWFAAVTEAVLFLPLAVWLLADSWSKLNSRSVGCLLATGFVHLLYAESLFRGYRKGDLSVVYPLARGSGPLLSFFGAILLLGERPSLVAGTGALLVTFGVLLLCGGAAIFRRDGGREGLFWGAATGVTIACYTLIDGYSVRILALSPFLVEYAGNIVRAVVLTERARRYRNTLRDEYRRYWKQSLAISVLTMGAYVGVLFAMRLAPISRVAPLREMSMMIGAWFGVKFFGEKHGIRRMIASGLIAAGVAALALG